MDQRGRLLAGAAAVVVLLAGVAFVGHAGNAKTPRSGGAVNARPVGEAAGAPGKPRPLVYAEGSTIHLGEKTIDTGQDLLSLDLTDDGVAFTTFNGGLWFTDGTTTTRIGTTSPGQVDAHGVAWGPSGRPKDWIVSDPSGSRMAWFEYDQDEQPEIVVYDTHEHQHVARIPIELDPGCARCPQILSVDADVYWTDTPMRGLGSDNAKDRQAVYRYSIATHKAKRVTAASYRTHLLHQSRGLVVGDSWATGNLTDGIGQRFSFSHQGTTDPQGQVFDAETGQRVVLRAPPGYGPGDGIRLYLFEWLDDDRVALLDATGWAYGTYGGENLLVCHLESGQCVVQVHRARSAVSPILPEFESRGDAFAEARAIRSSRRFTGS
jgi:hypothetical protein